jgi:hypothetical protein
MDARDEKTFLYHASALAIGGRITRPFCDIIESLGSAVLPISGGHGSSQIEDFNYRNLIRFRRATCTVSGSESRRDGARVFNSLATITIEGLNVNGVVTADQIVGRLASEQPEGRDEPPILPVGTSFVNLRVAGTPVEPVPCGEMMRCATLPEIEESCAAGTTKLEAPNGKCYAFKSALGEQRRVGGEAPFTSFEDRVLLTSVFELPDVLRSKLRQGGVVSPSGCRIPVAGFGTVVLGEYLVTRRARSLTMLKLDLGSPLEGTVALGLVQTNGHTFP